MWLNWQVHRATDFNTRTGPIRFRYSAQSKRRPVAELARRATAVLPALLFGLLVTPSLLATEPVLKALIPPGAQRGKPLTLTLKGEALTSSAEVVTTLPGTLSRLAPPKDAAVPDSELLYLLQVPEGAPVGLYPIRVRTNNGLSNVLIFSVGDFPEILEKEPNNTIEQAQPISPPVTISGNLTAADQDFFKVNARAHERLVMEVEARRMASGIDPAIEVLDSSGRRIAFNDDAPGLGVDARVEVIFPKTGTYYIVVHDSKYSDQETDFYRLKVGSFAYADGIFPLGGQRGKAVDVTFFGGNLGKPVKVRLNLDVPPERLTIPINLPGPKPIGTLPFQFQVSDYPEIIAAGGSSLTEIQASEVVNGRIERQGQVDRFRLKVSPGQHWLVHLQDASLATSRLYGGLTVYDPKQKEVPAQNVSEGPDPRLAFTVPDKVQELTLAVRDVRGLGGLAFGYRLVAQPIPGDFSLKLLTPYVNIPVNGVAWIEVLAERQGYNGSIQLSIPNLPGDVGLQGGNIAPPGPDYAGAPQKESRGRLTLTANGNAKPRVLSLALWGEGGPPDHPIRRFAEGPGIVLYPKDDPILDPQNNERPAKPVTAPWLGMELPAAISSPAPVTLQVADRSFRLPLGMSRPIKWKLASQGSGIVPETVTGSLEYSEIRGLQLGGERESKGKESGTLVLESEPDSPAVKFDMVLLAQLEIDGKKQIVAAPAITIELVPGYSVKLASDRMQVKGGGAVELAGAVQREPSFTAAVKVKIADPPDNVTCPAIEVPSGISEFRLACKVSPGAQGGDFEVHLLSSATIPGRKDNREYNLPPLAAHLVIGAEKGNQTVAGRQRPVAARGHKVDGGGGGVLSLPD
jgi:hypothetical protein